MDGGFAMPVSREQAQMLTTLAVACRPNGAPRWDAAGVMAEIGKVKDRQLADVILAVIRAADDRDAKTPGVISTPRSGHWRERGTDRPTTRHEWADDAHRCRTCSLPKAECDRIWQDHPFEPVGDRKRDPDTIAKITAALRQAKAETPPPQPMPETSTDGTERVAPVRVALAAARADTEGDADA
jgi:hypothetical protein